MTCPVCGCDKLDVKETRKLNDTIVSRIRECMDCGKRYETSEMIIGPRRNIK